MDAAARVPHIPPRAVLPIPPFRRGPAPRLSIHIALIALHRSLLVLRFRAALESAPEEHERNPRPSVVPGDDQVDASGKAKRPKCYGADDNGQVLELLVRHAFPSCDEFCA